MARRAPAVDARRDAGARGRVRRRALLALLALVASSAGAAAAADRHPLIPDQAKLQLAGTLGVVSSGPGWALFGRRLELDSLVGWVPARFAGAHLFTLTGKLTWLPLSVRIERWRLRPLTFALAVTHTFGDGFWLRLPSRYPEGYYPVPSALRGSLAAGGTLGRAVGSLRELGVYWEVVAGDIPLLHWARNQRAVRASDVLSVAFGIRAEL